MLEFFARLSHWLFIPNYLKVAERDLAMSHLKLRQYEANECYSRLMVEYYRFCISKDEALLQQSVASTPQPAETQATFTGRNYTMKK